MSRDIDARRVRRDPVVERLEASRDLAHRERDKAIALVADLTAELQRARRCLASARLSHEMQVAQWREKEADMRYRIEFAADYIRRHQAPRNSQTTNR